MERLNVKNIQDSKNKQALVCLTAYTAPFAKIMDKHTDILLVGDSVGMALYGMKSTLPVSVDIMINHGKAVVLATNRSFVVVDMPFASYQESKTQAFRNAARIMRETGCQAVKLEGGQEMAETIQFLVNRGIPVMGHVGLMPQHVNVYGSYAHHGKTIAQQKKIMADSVAVQAAGAFSLVIEGVKESLARQISKKLSIAVIGIGGSPKCDGQILVAEDMLGLFTDFTPKFVKKYTNLAEQIDKAVSNYAQDVRSRKFPGSVNCF